MEANRVEKLVDFVINNSPYKDRETVKSYIKQHISYGTFDYILDKDGEVVAVSRWNLTNSGTAAHVLDTIIRHDWRGKGLLKFLIKAGKAKFPSIEYIYFDREAKYGVMPSRVYKINKLLGKD